MGQEGKKGQGWTRWFGKAAQASGTILWYRGPAVPHEQAETHAEGAFGQGRHALPRRREEGSEECHRDPHGEEKASREEGEAESEAEEGSEQEGERCEKKARQRQADGGRPYKEPQAHLPCGQGQEQQDQK